MSRSGPFADTRIGAALAVVLAASTPAAGASPADDHAGLIAGAAARFGLPAPWIAAVMTVESAGRPRAVSRAGALGLMQVMPATYAELRERYGFGPDPFDPADNIAAGAAYLRELHDRFGAPGFLAAYNAGPDRYQQHLTTGRALPAETRRYLAVLAPQIAGAPGPAVAPPPSFFAIRATTDQGLRAAGAGLFAPVSGRETAP